MAVWETSSTASVAAWETKSTFSAATPETRSTFGMAVRQTRPTARLRKEDSNSSSNDDMEIMKEVRAFVPTSSSRLSGSVTQSRKRPALVDEEEEEGNTLTLSRKRAHPSRN